MRENEIKMIEKPIKISNSVLEDVPFAAYDNEDLSDVVWFSLHDKSITKFFKLMQNVWSFTQHHLDQEILPVLNETIIHKVASENLRSKVNFNNLFLRLI
jgi:hypothetical protein